MVNAATVKGYILIEATIQHLILLRYFPENQPCELLLVLIHISVFFINTQRCLWSKYALSE